MASVAKPLERMLPSVPPSKCTPKLDPGLPPFYPFADTCIGVSDDLWGDLVVPDNGDVLEMPHRPRPAVQSPGPPTTTDQQDMRPCTLIIEIQKATNLINADMYGASDPYVSFTWRGETYKTAVINDDLNPKWNETFQIPYDPSNDPEELQLFLWDEDNVTQHDRLGAAVIVVKKSRYQRTALKLDVTGYGGHGAIFCATERIPPVEIPIGTKEEAPTEPPAAPPVDQGDVRPCTLIIGIQKAQNLINADMYGASDPYVSFLWRDETYKTAVIQDTLHPKWNETFQVPYDPLADPEELELLLWDEDKVTQHDRLGNAVVPVKESSYKRTSLKLDVTGYGGRGFIYCTIQRTPFVEAPPCAETAQSGKAAQAPVKQSTGVGGSKALKPSAAKTK